MPYRAFGTTEKHCPYMDEQLNLVHARHIKSGIFLPGNALL